MVKIRITFEGKLRKPDKNNFLDMELDKKIEAVVNEALETTQYNKKIIEPVPANITINHSGNDFDEVVYNAQIRNALKDKEKG